MADNIISRNATRAVVAGLLSAGAAAGVAAPAAAVPVEVPGLPGVKIDLPGLENLPPEVAKSGLPGLPEGGIQLPISSIGDQIVSAAKSKVGSPYVWGATGPNAFDCSGLVSWAHQQVGISIPRTSQAQVASGKRVSRDQLRPGDVIAFYGGASHVGVYIGNGQVVHASTEGVPVGYASIDSMPFYGATRYF